MKAPICAICGMWVSVGEQTGDYVAFKAHSRNPIGAGAAGYPDGLVMFCSEHLQIARRYKRKWLRRLTWNEARPLIEKAIEKVKNSEGCRDSRPTDLAE